MAKRKYYRTDKVDAIRSHINGEPQTTDFIELIPKIPSNCVNDAVSRPSTILANKTLYTFFERLEEYINVPRPVLFYRAFLYFHIFRRKAAILSILTSCWIYLQIVDSCLTKCGLIARTNIRSAILQQFLKRQKNGIERGRI